MWFIFSFVIFAISTTFGQDEDCHCGFNTIRVENGSVYNLLSPGYPNNMTECQQRNCSLVVEVPEGMAVQVEILELCCTGWSPGERSIEIQHNSRLNVSRWSPNIVIFNLDFRAVPMPYRPSYSNHTYGSYNATCDCGQLDYVGSYGVVVSPNYPQPYCNNLQCMYSIIVPIGMAIRLEFTGRTESCCDRIIFPHRQLRGHLSGVMYIPDNMVEMEFRTDPSVTHQGFSISYRAVNHSEIVNDTVVDGYPTHPPPSVPGYHSQNTNCSCGESDHSGLNGTVRSHEGNDHYCNRMNCNYRIIAPEGYHIALRLEGRTERCCDHIITLHGMRYNGQLSSQETIYSDSNVLSFRFTTDSSVVDIGFTGYYQVIPESDCYNGGVMIKDRSPSGCYCPDPFYGNKCQYDMNRRCRPNH